MDIFVRNIPPQATNKQLEYQVKGPLNECGIHVFHVDKHRDKPQGFITVLDAAAGQRFLDRYGTGFSSGIPQRMKPKLRWGPNVVGFAKGRNEPSDFSVQALAYEAAQRAKAARTGSTASSMKQNAQSKKSNRYNLVGLENGTWDYAADMRPGRSAELVFMAHYTDTRPGQIIFGAKQAIILLGATGSDQCRIDLSYHECLDVNIDSYDQPAITFSMKYAPKIYSISGDEVIASALAGMSLAPGTRPVQKPKKVRVSAIPSARKAHAKAVATCFAYRVLLADARLLPHVRNVLQQTSKCPVKALKTRLRYPDERLEDSFIRLAFVLSDTKRYGRSPLHLRYQIERLARNGILSPVRVFQLLPKIFAIHKERGLDTVMHALKGFARDVNAEPPGPSVQPHIYTMKALEDLLDTHAASYSTHTPDSPFELAKRHTHIELVWKAIITPAGTYLEGPEPEPTNRVLRRYSNHGENFLRVVFQDEDGAPVRYDPRTDHSYIYHTRFKEAVLNQGIMILARTYSFLGFSHSSLRSGSCWFMAPMFSVEKGAILAETVIKELGDFSHIRIPAKCAARIGQNFTDTNATVELLPEQVDHLPVVTRNGRDFSDGVGTISHELLQRVWRVYGTKKLLKPTALQIRFQGYKGMVSLDPTLRGECLMLRDNMKKYHTSSVWHLEICGAAFRPLPMVLNRPFIKIFEDLGIPTEVFMKHQRTAMAQLRAMTESSINTSTLLEHADGVKATRVPQLIRYLGEIGVDYHRDWFLYSIVEMVVVSKVRDIKYRGRIPLEQGVTLYGIMDETGYLKEGEIFVVTEKAPEGGRHYVIKDRVVITRSPALHPGDVQVVNAVDVPVDSPLKELSNVVVFSQHGKRDLPSQLSGGDLDGDLYNVIWDADMIPNATYEAAEYPRVEAVQLDRAVTRRDMSDFFVSFMENDLLGMICTRHLQLADQRSFGVLDPDCVKLAELASTAVDFSKTGIPVRMKEAPETHRCRPDFMAPSPRVIVHESGQLDFEEEEETNAMDDDAFEGLDSELRPIRYYASNKTLGQLYRAIDERQFLQHMQNQHHRYVKHHKSNDGVLPDVLKYVLKQVQSYGIIYVHHKPLAVDIQAGYEESLLNIQYDHEPSPRSPVSEAEVFSGQILGRLSGPQGKPLRELSKVMRERFENIVEYSIMRITKGDQQMKSVQEAGGDLDDLYDDTLYDDREFEALPRAVACLEVSVNSPGTRDPMVGKLESFKYVAAAVCLKELERYRITTFGSYGLPPLDG